MVVPVVVIAVVVSVVVIAVVVSVVVIAVVVPVVVIAVVVSVVVIAGLDVADAVVVSVVPVLARIEDGADARLGPHPHEIDLLLNPSLIAGVADDRERSFVGRERPFGVFETVGIEPAELGVHAVELGRLDRALRCVDEQIAGGVEAPIHRVGLCQQDHGVDVVRVELHGAS